MKGKSMRILVLCDRLPPDHSGGAEVIAWNFTRALRDLGHSVEAVVGTDGTPFGDVRDGIAITHIHSNWPSRFTAFFTLGHPTVTRQMAAIFDDARPDLVAAFNIHNALTYHSLTQAHQRGIPTVLYHQDAMAVACGKLTHFVTPAQDTYAAEDYRLPAAYNLQQQRLRFNPLRNRTIRRILTHKLHTNVAISQALASALHVNGLPEMPVIYPGQDAEAWQSTPEQAATLRKKLGLADQPTILLAGRLNPAKGSVQLLKALEQVKLKIPHVRLLLLTRSTPEQQGLDRPEFASLRENIVVGGWLQGDDLVRAYHAADVIVTPSIYLDPLIAVNQEAMACKKPVVTTCFGGPPEVVTDGETGYVVNPFNTGLFAERLVTILSDAGLAARMGEAGYARFESHFRLNDRAAELASVYAQAIHRVE
jgi:glycosyltransferase involved in cell wall biosynthesis